VEAGKKPKNIALDKTRGPQELEEHKNSVSFENGSGRNGRKEYCYIGSEEETGDGDKEHPGVNRKL
jgi:hypothetical protein